MEFRVWRRTRRTLVLVLALGLVAVFASTAEASTGIRGATIAPGGFHVCAIKTDGTPVCWGTSAEGQTTIPAGTGTVTEIVSGNFHSCAIKSDGTPVCWGRGVEGQTTIPSGIGTVRQISAGNFNACAVKTDGTPVCWGADGNDQSTVPDGIGAVVQVAAGPYHSCAIKADGTPLCWGYDGSGETTIPNDIGVVSAITVGFSHTCAIKADGNVACWGSNASGQTTIPPGIGEVKAISASSTRTCAIKKDGTPICWGDDSEAANLIPAGTGPVTQIKASLGGACAVNLDGTPVCWGLGISFPADLGTVAPPDVSVGYRHTCASRADGTPACWGAASGGATSVPPDLGIGSRISAGVFRSCAIKPDGVPVCWGSTQSGAATVPDGIGTVSQIDGEDSGTCVVKTDGTPVCWDSNPPPADIGTVSKVAVGDLHSCAIKSNGTADCWGLSPYGATDVPASLGPVIDIDAGQYHTCAVKVDGTLICWGKLGSPDLYVPAGLGPVRKVATGRNHTCVIKVDGILACWGENLSGQSTVPAALGTVVDVDAGDGHTCVVKTSGQLACWGYNSGGQLGGPPSFTSSAPASPIRGVAFSHTFTAGPANGPSSTFSLVAGTLPTGLALASDGSLIGTPSAEGTFDFTVGASNGLFGPDATQVVSITVDLTAPAKPSVGLSPTSPSTSTAVTATGVAESGSTVKLYKSAACAGSPVASGTASTFASPGFALTADGNATTNFTATTTDAAGNVSACSDSVPYVNDTIAPAKPTLALGPASPSASTAVTATGSAEAGSTVKLYKSASCGGAPVASGAASAFAAPGLSLTADENATTSFTATATDAAGNVSACSDSVSFVNDASAPAKPTLALAPASPSASTAVTATGAAESGSTVKLYKSATCDGAPVTSGTAAEFASPGLPLSADADATTSFTATATDGVGNVSACSDAASFVNDSTAPDAPSGISTDTDSPSSATNLRIFGSAETGSTVELFDNAGCTGSPVSSGPAAAFATPGLDVTVAPDSSTHFSARAIDGVGNTSGCSDDLFFVNDSTPPAAPGGIGSSEPSPSTSTSIKIFGSAEPGSTVRIYANGDCSGTPIATGTPEQLAAGIPVGASGVVNSYSLTVTDAAGNVSACTSSVTHQVVQNGLIVKPSLATRKKGSRVNFAASIAISGAGVTADSCQGTLRVVARRSKNGRAFPKGPSGKPTYAKLYWTGTSCTAKLRFSKSAKFTTRGVRVKVTLQVLSPTLSVPDTSVTKKF